MMVPIDAISPAPRNSSTCAAHIASNTAAPTDTELDRHGKNLAVRIDRGNG